MFLTLGCIHLEYIIRFTRM